MNEPIVRIAARGDGVTPSGRHVPFGVPGDVLLDDGALAFGSHHRDPPCNHFPQCGGCQLQHADDDAYAAYVLSRIEYALVHHGLETQLRTPHLSPPRSRRRIALKAMQVGKQVLLGFNAEMSHRIVDMHECHVMRPELFALVEPIRRVLDGMVHPKRTAEVQLTWVDQGADVLLKGVPAGRLSEVEKLTAFALQYDLARLSVDRGLGPDTIFAPRAPTVSLSGVPVTFPHGSFLQATEDGEDALVQAVREIAAGASVIGDLFAGLGTFALAVRAGYAAEASRDAASALKRALPSATVEHRDLYRRPLDRNELKRFDMLILDPPRAGAEEQIAELSRCSIPRVAYVSCNPATFARDAKVLVEGGYRLDWIEPVGQFRWSTHVELAASFSARQ